MWFFAFFSPHHCVGFYCCRLHPAASSASCGTVAAEAVGRLDAASWKSHLQTQLRVATTQTLISEKFRRAQNFNRNSILGWNLFQTRSSRYLVRKCSHTSFLRSLASVCFELRFLSSSSFFWVDSFIPFFFFLKMNQRWWKITMLYVIFLNEALRNHSHQTKQQKPVRLVEPRHVSFLCLSHMIEHQS